MKTTKYWEDVYLTTSDRQVSWYQGRAEKSIHFIQEAKLTHQAAIIDVGAGASSLVDDLLGLGYLNLTITDLSASVLDKVKQRLGERSQQVNWQVGDITQSDFDSHSIDFWHDRAVFHFLTNPAERQAYINTLTKSVKPGGYAMIATFAADGPKKCSDLPVQRYNPKGLYALFSSSFELLDQQQEIHQTPLARSQKFIYCFMRKQL
jgi:2-polyprenyl-3-methyl-5-hydroxy-6-metoxy-1,4-benzoquinol methylase